MPKITELCQNPAFEAKLRDAFVPNSKQLTQVWNTDQNQWGKHNVDALRSLEKWFDRPRVTPLTLKKIYLAAGGLRKQIAEKMTGETNYAASRFNEGVGYLETVFTGYGRYRDQVDEGFNLIAALPLNDPNLEVANATFLTKLSPLMHDPRIQFSNQNYVNVSFFNHRLQIGDRVVRLATVRAYAWFHEPTESLVPYFDVVNPQNVTLEPIFNHLESLGFDLWGENRMADAVFYEKLADWAWYMAQVSPLVNGSASTTELLMKYALLKQFGDEAPLYFKPGVSWDIMAMVTTRETFRDKFKALLQTERSPQNVIDAAYHVEQNSAVNLMQDRQVRKLLRDQVTSNVIGKAYPLFMSDGIPRLYNFEAPVTQIQASLDNSIAAHVRSLGGPSLRS